MSRSRFTKRQRIAPASFFFEPDLPERKKRKRAPDSHNVAQIEVAQPQVGPREPAIAAAPPEIETPPPSSTSAPVLPDPSPLEAPQHTASICTKAGEVVCQWCGQSVELPADGGYLRPFVVGATAHLHSPTRGRRRKPVLEQPAHETRALTWAEIERRSERFWTEYYARRMSEAA